MELTVEVEREKCRATFTVFAVGDSTGKQFRVFSPILSQPYREFVPFFEMYRIGDAITWHLP